MTARLPDPLALLNHLGACSRGRDIVRRCWPGATWKMLWQAVTTGAKANAYDAIWFAFHVGVGHDAVNLADHESYNEAFDIPRISDEEWDRWNSTRAAIVGRLIPYSLIEERLIAIAKEMNGG